VAAPEKGMRNAILLLLTIAVAALQWAAFRTEALTGQHGRYGRFEKTNWPLHEGMSVMHSWKWGEAE
jgi:hypothetical protein